MHGHANWRSAIAITCAVVSILGVIVWMRKKSDSKTQKTDSKKPKDKEKKLQENGKKESGTVNQSNNCQNNISNKVVPSNGPRNDAIPELPKPKWRKVGQVKELYFYPLKSGRGKSIPECNFTVYGISVREEGRLALRDRMFLVYNEETQEFQTSRHYPTMTLISVSAVDEFKAKMDAVGMPSLSFGLPSDSKKDAEAIECKLWWGEPVNCIDCGDETARWLSSFLTGTTTGLRLVCTVLERGTIAAEVWQKYTELYKTLRNEDMDLCSDLSSYMLLTTQSLDELNEKLESPLSAIQFRPNVVVDAEGSFKIDDWEWIKVGPRAVLRNTKQCTRFREQTDPDCVQLEGRSPLMRINCGLYITGNVKIGDDVFLHIPEDSSLATPV